MDGHGKEATNCAPFHRNRKHTKHDENDKHIVPDHGFPIKL